MIRALNGTIRVWGARTLGGDDANGEFKYINVRRLMIFLRSRSTKARSSSSSSRTARRSGSRSSRSVTAFLTSVWRDGALFGETPEQAFFVKCDETTNPPDVRDSGQVITEIGWRR